MIEIEGLTKRYGDKVAVDGLSFAVASAGCGSGGRASTGATPQASPPTTTAAATSPGATTNGPGPLQAEAASAAAGDIPDNQIFLTFRNQPAGYSMKYPEGWAQRGSGDSVTFRDGDLVRPVAPFYEIWARVGDTGGALREVPLTPALLQANGLALAALQMKVTAQNLKAEIPFNFRARGAVMPDDERVWVPQAPGVWFRPLLLNTVSGGWCNLLRVRRSGILSRHRHPMLVVGYVIKGRWRYLEHEWVAEEGSFVYEPPGETHTLVVPEDCAEMITFFNIAGAMIYLDEQGRQIGYEDVWTKIASAPAASAASRLRASISTTMAPLPPIAFNSDSAIRPSPPAPKITIGVCRTFSTFFSAL
jgi:quercetin dioxygenase-like cupin family protein